MSQPELELELELEKTNDPEIDTTTTEPPLWPPTDQGFLRIAKSAASHLEEKKFTSVLVYADNPSIMIFDPVHINGAPREMRGFSVQLPTGKHEFTVIISEID